VKSSRIRIAALSLLAVGLAVVGVALGAVASGGLQADSTVRSQTHNVQADSYWGETAILLR
jgi:hypothetical protein